MDYLDIKPLEYKVFYYDFGGKTAIYQNLITLRNHTIFYRNQAPLQACPRPFHGGKRSCFTPAAERHLPTMKSTISATVCGRG